MEDKPYQDYVDIDELKTYFSFYKDELIPAIKEIPEVTQKDYGYHGFFTHTEGVVFRGIFYALASKKDPLPVIFACATHDLARKNDFYEEEHGKNAVPIAITLMDKFGDMFTSDEHVNSVLDAIANHTTGRDAKDYVSACLRDADRTRLSWERGYIESCYSTEIGKTVASGDPHKFIEFENEVLGRGLDVDNEGIFLPKNW